MLTFAEYVGDVVVDAELNDLFYRMSKDLYPSTGPSPLSYGDVMAMAIATAPLHEVDLWKSLGHRLPYLPQDNVMLDNIVNGVYNYYRNYKAPQLVFHTPTDDERVILLDLANSVRSLDTIEDITSVVYEVGKRNYWSAELRAKIDAIPVLDVSGMDDDAAKIAKKAHKDAYGSIQSEGQNLLRAFFILVYTVTLGQEDGPRIPLYIDMLGPEKFAHMIERILEERV
jgi:lysyl-tRNA synthetase class I